MSWDLQREALRDQGYATPEFGALAPVEQLRIREQVLPFVWAALESLERPPAGALDRIRALCDEWDVLSKGETTTTRRIREALG